MELETLSIFGWNADYIGAFRAMLQHENLTIELRIQTQLSLVGWEDLPVPRTSPGYDVDQETWTLDGSGPRVTVETIGRVGALASGGEGRQTRVRAGDAMELDFTDPATFDLLDLSELHARLVDYKTTGDMETSWSHPV